MIFNKKHKTESVDAPSAESGATLPTEEYREPAAPWLLCLVCMGLSLVACVINAFVYPFGDNLLAPVILELVAIVFPSYLILLTVYPRKTPIEQMRAIGFRRVEARYVFFLIFAALFMMSASMLVSIIFGGVYSSAEGLVLLGTFTAGENEFNVSWPYLVLAYALIPAVAEELLLRGVAMSQMDGMGFAARAAVSCVMSALVGFSLGGFIPSLVSALMLCFVFYTTRSLWACIGVHLIFNLYRLFWESNISAYYVSTSSRGLLLTVLVVVLLISGALFFGESAKIYRENTGGEQGKTLSLDTFKSDIKKIVSFRPTVIFSAVCAAVFVAASIIGYLS